MGRIPENIISEVLERSDMLQIIGEYVRLKRAGQNHKGLCPFHSEKTPSFTVSPTRGFFKCFGCGAGGTVYTFLMKAEGWSFPEAVRHVAARVGIEVPELDDEDAAAARKKRKQRESYQNTLGLAQQWFEDNLWGPESSGPRQYLLSRGVDEDAARAFGLGYAPEAWSGLLDHLRTKRISGKDAEEAGLVIQGQRGHYDRFRDRIIFPVVDIWGKAVAFGGRRLKDDGPRAGAKYINSPETSFYTKGSQLYGLAATKRAVRSEGWALLVEGNFDVVVLYARGIQNAVAPMGTALTERQARLLSRYTHRVYVAFDADKAGREATLRSLPILLRHKLDARVVPLPDGDDPDSLIQREGQQALLTAIERARPIVAHALDQILQPLEFDGAPIEEKVAAMSQLGEILSNVQDNVTWKHYAEEISRRLDLDLKDTLRLLRQPTKNKKHAPSRAKTQRATPQNPQNPRPQAQRPKPKAQRPSPASSPDEPPAWLSEAPPIEDLGELAQGPPPGPLPPGFDEVIPQEAPAPEPVALQTIPKLEGQCFQILTDMPERLGEFIEASCCQLMTDERLVNLIERAHERHARTEKPPEYALVAQQLANELGDQNFFDQISALLCSDRSYTEVKMEQTYLDTITELQRRWIKTEEKKIQRLLAAVDQNPGDAMKVLIRQRELNRLRADLDVRLQRKRL